MQELRAEPVGSAKQKTSTFVIGVDVGGTFTDTVCSDGTTTWRAKAPTNPARFADGVLGSCKLLAKQAGLSLNEVLARTERFGLGTTAVTNVLATGVGRTVGLITTAGFENHLHAMRNHRKVVQGWLTQHWLPVRHDAVRGIAERVDRDGKVLQALEVKEVERAARYLVEEKKVDAFAVSFLWSIRNGAHEQLATDTIRRLYPALPVFSGRELHPIMREYERTSLAVLNAFTSDALEGVEELEQELKRLGLAAPMLLLHSSGGAMTVPEGRATPLSLASSGPAAGAVAACEAAIAAGFRNAVCCDMGGTSIDVGVVSEGVAERRSSIEIGGIVTGMSAVDVESIGAGGGSIAWIDGRGVLRVGPQSARATPGPVCYRRGGTEPTVTDAMILLGYIDPAAFMGGRMNLDVEAARSACERLGKKLGYSALEVAHGIREIALAEMSKAMRSRISRGGIDVRKYGVVAFGGSGSLFATSMAKDLELSWVLTPVIASVLSAYGAATANILRERSQAIDELLPLTTDRAYRVLEDLKRRAAADLEAQGVAPERRELVCELELRFFKQRSVMTLQLDERGFEADALLKRFRDGYAAQYGDSSLTAQTPVELSTVRVNGIGKVTGAVMPKGTARSEPGAQPLRSGERRVYVARSEAQSIPVYVATALRIGDVIAGPALIDSVDATLWAPPDSQVEVIPSGSFLTKWR